MKHLLITTIAAVVLVGVALFVCARVCMYHPA